MVSISVVLPVTEPTFPLIVTLNVPVGALRPTVMFRTEEPGTGTGFGLKLALVAPGKRLTLRLTGLEPWIVVAVTVADPLDLRFTVSDLGDTERLKSGGGGPPPATLNEPIAVLHR
jgi:hypothetical protein